MSDNQPLGSTGNDNSKHKFIKKGTIARGAETIGSENPQTEPISNSVLSKNVSRRTFVKVAAGGAAVVGLALAAPKLLINAVPSNKKNTTTQLNYKGKITNDQRKTAASTRPLANNVQPTVVPAPGGTPDYFGTTPNYANSPLPTVTGAFGTGITLTGFSLQNGGKGYTTPTVILTGGGGTGATATARVSGGVIFALTLTNPGTGYTSAPTVTLRDPQSKS